MEKLKVLDFDYGCGGFTKGLEDSGLFEVIYNGSINEKNSLCYNNVHINSFNKEDVMPKDVDLVVFTPNLGHTLYGKGEKNFIKSQLDNFTALVTINDFDNLIFITQREAIPLLQLSSEVLLTSDDMPTKDIIACRLIDLGYFVYNFVLDGAGYGLPQHKYYNIYWASKKIDESIFIKEGHGIYKRPYRQVQHLIGDVRDESRLTWHEPDYTKKRICSLIKPGDRASSTKSLAQSSGYIRLNPNDLASPSLLYNFYNVSSRGPSINPWYDRPLTIREGARLFGLTDDFTWDLGLSKKDVGLMIYESFSPMVSKLMAHKISVLIKKNE